MNDIILIGLGLAIIGTTIYWIWHKKEFKKKQEIAKVVVNLINNSPERWKNSLDELDRKMYITWLNTHTNNQKVIERLFADDDIYYYCDHIGIPESSTSGMFQGHDAEQWQIVLKMYNEKYNENEEIDLNYWKEVLKKWNFKPNYKPKISKKIDYAYWKEAIKNYNPEDSKIDIKDLKL